MYVCMYTYVLQVSHVSARSCTCACTYVSMTYLRIRICVVLGFMCLRLLHAFGQPWELYTRAYIHTYDVAAHCATVGTTPSLLGRASARTHVCAYVKFTWVYVSCMRWASHESYGGLHTHKQCCCTLCYCSTTSSLLVRDDTVRKLLALQTDSSARGTPCTMSCVLLIL